MKKTRVTSPAAPEPAPGTWSNCLVVGNQIFVAGLTAGDGKGGVTGEGEYEQARAIFAKMRGLIEAAGGKMNDVVKVNIFVTEIRNREEVWKARREVFTGDFPVSTLVEVSALATPALKVEIEAVAFIGCG